MIPFVREGDDLVASFEAFEAALLASLVGQVADLLGGSGPVTHEQDPFAQWAAEFRAGVNLDRSDPVIARLFPDAYEDATAAGEHHRFSQEALRRGRIEDAEVVSAALVPIGEAGGAVVVGPEAVEAWLRVLNGVRLALAVRLGVETASDYDQLSALPARDPRAQLVDLYDWLGFVQESLLEALADE